MTGGRKKGFHISEEQKQFLSNFWKGKRLGDENVSRRPEVRKKIKLSWINDYQYLCRGCHMKYDYKFGIRRIKKIKKK